MADTKLKQEAAPGGRQFTTPDYELAPSASRTADFNSEWIDLEDFKAAQVLLKSAAASAGTLPTLDVKVQHSDNKTDVFDVGSGAFSQVTTSAVDEVLNFANLLRFVRVRGVLGGTATPTFTWSARINLQK